MHLCLLHGPGHNHPLKRAPPVHPASLILLLPHSPSNPEPCVGESEPSSSKSQTMSQSLRPTAHYCTFLYQAPSRGPFQSIPVPKKSCDSPEQPDCFMCGAFGVEWGGKRGIRGAMGRSCSAPSKPCGRHWTPGVPFSTLFESQNRFPPSESKAQVLQGKNLMPHGGHAD